MRLLFALLLAFSVSGSAMATSAESEETVKALVTLRKVESSKIQLLYGAIPDGSVLVKIFDEQNHLVQTDRIVAKKAFSKYYDFSKLKPGIYSVSVLDRDGEIDHLEIDLREQPAVAPVVYTKLDQLESNKYKLLINSLLPSDMSILIYENDRLVHKEELDQTTGFQKVYVFNRKVPGSKVEFYVKGDNGYSKLLATR